VKRHLSLGLALLLVGGSAFAVVSTIQRTPWVFLSNVYVGPTGDVTAGNKVTKLLGASSSIDFAGVTDTCEDSSGITLTGAAAGDVCAVGAPSTMPSATSWITCYVSAANTVKVRHCSHGASGNPAAQTYYVRVISSQ
jgi:hypothetical protein